MNVISHYTRIDTAARHELGHRSGPAHERIKRATAAAAAATDRRAPVISAIRIAHQFGAVQLTPA